MTLRTLYTVDCDGRPDGTRHPSCLQWVGSIGTEQQVRWRFGHNGWRQILDTEPGGPADRCPWCAADSSPSRGIRGVRPDVVIIDDPLYGER